MRALGRTVASEVCKLRGLPAVAVVVVCTIVASAVLGAALAARERGNADIGAILVQVVSFMQVGPIALAAIGASSEYAGRQIVVSLTATPHRVRLLMAKAIACFFLTTASALAGELVAAASAWLVVSRAGGRPHIDGWMIGRAAVYLALIGLFALALAMLLRSLLASVAAMLVLIFIASPLLSGYPELARWMPDVAGREFYVAGGDDLLAPMAGLIVLLAWIMSVGVVAVATFVRRDA